MRDHLLAIVACCILLGFSTRAPAVALSSQVDADLAVRASAPIEGVENGPWLWTMLNAWASSPTSGPVSQHYCSCSLLAYGELADARLCNGTLESSQGDAPVAEEVIQLAEPFSFLVANWEVSGTTHSSTSSSAPPTGPAPQAGLPVKLEVLCYKNVARLAAEGNFLELRDYVLSLFRPPRAS